MSDDLFVHSEFCPQLQIKNAEFSTQLQIKNADEETDWGSRVTRGIVDAMGNMDTPLTAAQSNYKSLPVI